MKLPDSLDWTTLDGFFPDKRQSDSTDISEDWDVALHHINGNGIQCTFLVFYISLGPTTTLSTLKLSSSIPEKVIVALFTYCTIWQNIKDHFGIQYNGVHF